MQPARHFSKAEQHELFFKAFASEIIILLFLGDGNIRRADFATHKKNSHSTFMERYFFASERHQIFMDSYFCRRKFTLVHILFSIIFF
jgi:hypothetical protein